MTVWAWVLIVVGVLLLVYEFTAIAQHRLTISQLVWRESLKRPYLPFGFGFLAGHFFA